MMPEPGESPTFGHFDAAVDAAGTTGTDLEGGPSHAPNTLQTREKATRTGVSGRRDGRVFAVPSPT